MDVGQGTNLAHQATMDFRFRQGPRQRIENGEPQGEAISQFLLLEGPSFKVRHLRVAHLA
jgi:hypothetical protein